MRTATFQVGETSIRIAVVHGLVHAQELIKEIEAGTAYYDLVEVMTCQSGCVGGAGQPYGLKLRKEQRAAGLYEADRSATIKCSDRNPIVSELYEEGLKVRHKELLHVHYGQKDKKKK